MIKSAGVRPTSFSRLGIPSVFFKTLVKLNMFTQFMAMFFRGKDLNRKLERRDSLRAWTFFILGCREKFPGESFWRKKSKW